MIEHRLILLALGGALLGGCANDDAGSKGGAPPATVQIAPAPAGHTHTMHVDWIAAPRPRKGGVPIVVSKVAVEDVVRASPAATNLQAGPVAAGTEIEVREIGGTLADGCSVAPDDCPAMEPGDEVVLFLSPMQGTLPLATASAAGVCNVTGGYQGRFSVQAGAVRSLAASVHPEDPVAAYDGRDVAAFVREVRALPGTSP